MSAPSDQPSSTTLIELGGRVRAWRARRGMTRRQLAADSGLSERFLADVESGKGNVSINSLELAATALHVTLIDLLQDAPRPAVARAQILLGRLDDSQLDQARALLAGAFGLADARGREKRIALIGLRGAGKSTLGAQLALQKGVPFIELDREIEREAGTSMSEILLLHGQAGYRRYERRALHRVADDYVDGVVMTTGGSIVSERDTFDLLQSRFYCVWLKTSPEEHMSRVIAQGDMRPFGSERVHGAEPAHGDSRGTVNSESREMAHGESREMVRGAMAAALEDLRGILASREALYSRADAIVDTAARTASQSFKDLERVVS